MLSYIYIRGHMKNILLLLLFISSILANDAIKGQTYYLYLLKDHLGYNGSVFAKKYTQEEWQIMFQDNANSLKQFLIKENPELKQFTTSKKFEKITPFLKVFVHTYAKDVKSSPQCN